eukprot:g15668.t1
MAPFGLGNAPLALIGECSDEDEEDGDFFPSDQALLPVDFDGLRARASAVGALVAPTTKTGRNEKWHVIFLIDTSGSMRTVDVEDAGNGGARRSRIEFVVDVLRDFAASQKEDPQAATDLYSAAGFNDDYDIWFRHVGHKKGKMDSFLRDLDVTPCAGTRYRAALDAACALHYTMPDRRARKTRIILLSDGRAADWNTCNSEWYQRAFLESFQPLGVQVECQIAALGKGVFHFSKLAVSDLRRTFTSISQTMTQLRSTSTCVGGNSNASSSSRSGPTRDLQFRPTPREFSRFRGSYVPLQQERGNAMGYANIDAFPLQCELQNFYYDLGDRPHAFYYELYFSACLMPLRTRTMRLKRARYPFIKGNMRFVFGLEGPTEEDAHTLLVAKESLQTETTPAAELTFVRSTCAARYYAEKFRERSGLNLEFVPITLCTVVENLEKPKNQHKQGVLTCFCAEEYVPGVFKKWTNNSGYISSDKDAHLLECFSHYTYQASGGKIMVTDLQGVQTAEDPPSWKLTDPQVLSDLEDGAGFDDLFGRADRGKQGMIEFFSQHKCGEMCQKLGLHLRAHPGGVGGAARPFGGRPSSSGTRSTQPGDRCSALDFLRNRRIMFFGECECSFALAAVKLVPIFTYTWAVSDKFLPQCRKFFENEDELVEKYNVDVLDKVDALVGREPSASQTSEPRDLALWVMPYPDRFCPTRPVGEALKEEMRARIFGFVKAQGGTSCFNEVAVILLSKQHLDWGLRKEVTCGTTLASMKTFAPSVKLLDLKPLLDRGYEPKFGDARDETRAASYHTLCECVLVSWTEAGGGNAVSGRGVSDTKLHRRCVK